MIVLPRKGLYALVDTTSLDARGIDVQAFAEAVLAGGPALLQLRAKDADDARTTQLLRSIGALARVQGVPFFANDRPDLAVAAEVPGVHVGQTDEAAASVRERYPSLLVGVSTHDEAQLESALATGPSYVAFGPVFPTTSKRDADPIVGLARLERATARAAEHALPLVAIGGIGEDNAAGVARAGALAAVIGALLPDPGDDALVTVTAKTRRLAALLGATR